MSYLSGNAPSGETSKGYSGDYVLDKAAKLADLRRNDNTLFRYIAELGVWRNASNFAESVAYSRDPKVIPDTQVISNQLLNKGYDGIWYRSVRTPPGPLGSSGECLVLFEGRDNLLRLFADIIAERTKSVQ